MKDLIKPPFATYDVVVYFGGGLFLIPFLNRFVFEPFSLTWPEFKIKLGTDISSEIVSALALLFSIYVIGHILAYIGSQFIEKLFDRFLGKISTAILISAWSSSRMRNEHIRALIFDRTKQILEDKATFVAAIRLAPHLPVIPLYAIIYLVGAFGYYDTRLPHNILKAVNEKLPQIGIPDLKVGIRTKWYKPLEYYVINRSPQATARMYNYLVIGGLFRSMAVIFLFSIWMELYYLAHFNADAHWYIHPLMGAKGRFAGLGALVLTSVAFMFSVFSYLKFQRRYAEEAIFAFVFCDADRLVDTGPSGP